MTKLESFYKKIKKTRDLSKLRLVEMDDKYSYPFVNLEGKIDAWNHVLNTLEDLIREELVETSKETIEVDGYIFKRPDNPPEFDGKRKINIIVYMNLDDRLMAIHQGSAVSEDYGYTYYIDDFGSVGAYYKHTKQIECWRNKHDVHEPFYWDYQKQFEPSNIPYKELKQLERANRETSANCIICGKAVGNCPDCDKPITWLNFPGCCKGYTLKNFAMTSLLIDENKYNEKSHVIFPTPDPKFNPEFRGKKKLYGFVCNDCLTD